MLQQKNQNKKIRKNKKKRKKKKRNKNNSKKVSVRNKKNSIFRLEWYIVSIIKQGIFPFDSIKGEVWCESKYNQAKSKSNNKLKRKKKRAKQKRRQRNGG